MTPGYLLRQTDDADACEISVGHYEPPCDFYDSTADPDDLVELLDPERRKDVYFSVRDDGDRLVGFFQFENEGYTVDVGLGLRPDLTGRGLGAEFVRAGLAFARERFTLSVATFNVRAIRTYERAGFRRGEVYVHETNGGEHEFLRMEREA